MNSHVKKSLAEMWDEKENPTPQLDRLLVELNKLKSNTLSYPCEQQLIELARTLERRGNRLHAALHQAVITTETDHNELHHGYQRDVKRCQICQRQRKWRAVLEGRTEA